MTTHRANNRESPTVVDLRGRRAARAAGGCVRLVAPSRQVRKLRVLTGSDRGFLTFDSLDEAVAARSPLARDRPEQAVGVADAW
jgi:hypothetical protein